jgi:uncharacterized protein YdiU (UPF0061 family)
MPPDYRPDPRWLQLGPGLHDVVAPAGFPSLRLRWRNDRAAVTVGLAHLDDDAWIEHLARFAPLPDNLPEPLALRYHGHQFGHYNPYLGDGRGFLYAQMRDAQGRLLDLGTKGSGTTPWSRGGDGRLTLKGGVRELLASEYLEALGVPTCRTLSLVETGESLDRHDEPSPTRACVMVRLSHGHVRFGTFQRLAAIGDDATMARLVGYCAAHLHPGIAPEPRALLESVARACGWMVGAWTAAGFVHGVLNTDNMSITGESFDYGPWRFLPVLDPDFVAAYFDHDGLYAFGQQPDVVRWNLGQLERALARLGQPLDGALEGYATSWHAGLRATFLRRLGVASAGEAADTTLVEACLTALARTRTPLAAWFAEGFGGRAAVERVQAGSAWRGDAFALPREMLAAFAPTPSAQRWLARGTPAGPAVGMEIEEVERVWAPVAERDDWSAVMAKVADVRALGERLGLVASPG